MTTIKYKHQKFHLVPLPFYFFMYSSLFPSINLPLFHDLFGLPFLLPVPLALLPLSFALSFSLSLSPSIFHYPSLSPSIFPLAVRSSTTVLPRMVGFINPKIFLNTIRNTRKYSYSKFVPQGLIPSGREKKPDAFLKGQYHEIFYPWFV